jgi:hypothetical protein
MPAQATGVDWESALEPARGRARKEGKPLLLDFSAAPM